jgi:MIP family channel proteins
VTTEAAAAAAVDVVPARGPAAFVAEFIGTFGLVFFITMVVSEFGRTPVSQGPGLPTVTPFIDFSVIGLVHVLILFMLIQSLALISGAHFNPAITASLAAIRQIRPVDAAIYIVVQLAGAIVGALLCKAILHDYANAKALHFGAVSLGDAIQHKVGLGMIVEGVGTFFFVWAVVGVAVNPQASKAWAGLVIGGTLGTAVMIGGALTGGGFNPARAFGASLVGHHFDKGGGDWLLIWVVAPVIGGLLAAFIYMQMFILPGKKGPFGVGPVG